MLTTPVVLIAFKRPELTRRTLEAIRDAQPTDLYVVLDGPRPDHPDDAPMCAAVRDVIDEIDWCTVHRRYSDVNLGCEGNVELGLDWVFSQASQAIILEDDCIADPSFFQFADELLDRYRDDARVWHVAGNSHWVEPSSFGDLSYDFSTWASVWGWATWDRAWKEHRRLFPRDHQGTADTGRTADLERVAHPTPAPGALVTESARRHFTAVAEASADDYGWDSHWWLTIMSEGGLSATPKLNLVANDGFGEGATHTRSNRPVTPAEAISFPLNHPAAVQLNVNVERDLEIVLLRANGRLARTVRKLVKPLWMRTIIRRAVSSKAAWFAVKTLSRLTHRLRGMRTPGNA